MPKLRTKSSIVLCALFLAVASLSAQQSSGNGELLYNGIRLPAEWPPSNVALSSEPPPTAPYLLDPPAVIPINIGRQLFVDHFLVEHTNLRRVFHTPELYPGNPVLQADQRWEVGNSAGWAMPFSDGVFFDPADNLFKLWYRSDPGTLYATSRDGVHWDKPELDVRPGTNIVHRGYRDSSTVWLDLEESDPERRYKFLYSSGHMMPLKLHFSSDGIHWGEPVASSGPASDRSTFFYNPFREVWVLSLRDHDWTPAEKTPNPDYIGRLRKYWEHEDLVEAINFRPEDPKLWTMADRLDPRRIDLNVRPQLYNLDAVAYESLMVGLFTIWRGQGDDREKPNDVVVGFSRDGFHWHRPSRKPLVTVSEKHGDWNYTNVQSAGGAFLVVGDRLYFYFSGRGGVPGVRAPGKTYTALATMRRDGFASMEAGEDEGSLTTRLVVFDGKHLFVNVDATEGELRAEILDEAGQPIEPFTREHSVPVRSDNTLQRMTWNNAASLEALAGKSVRFRFYLRAGRLYSFWVSPDETGASLGYVGAGGPGFQSSRDTVGSRSYGECCTPPVW